MYCALLLGVLDETGHMLQHLDVGAAAFRSSFLGQGLNKFDEILNGFAEEYEPDKLQLNPFTLRTKSIVVEILRFETLLLDNSTNRKLFASYDASNHCKHIAACF